MHPWSSWSLSRHGMRTGIRYITKIPEHKNGNFKLDSTQAIR